MIKWFKYTGNIDRTMYNVRQYAPGTAAATAPATFRRQFSRLVFPRTGIIHCTNGPTTKYKVYLYAIIINLLFINVSFTQFEFLWSKLI